MPCNYTIEQDGAIVIELWTGSVTADEIITHKERLARDRSVRADAAVLSDCTRARFAVTPEDISKMSAMDSGPKTDSNIARYAFLVSDSDYDNAQIFAEQVNRFGKSVIIFSTLDVAATWLGFDTPELSALLERISR